MANKKWTHLKLKNGDTVQFVPPAPDGAFLGGVTVEEKALITELKSDISELQNTGDSPATAGKVWTSTSTGASWSDATGGGVSQSYVDTQVATKLAKSPASWTFTADEQTAAKTALGILSI